MHAENILREKGDKPHHPRVLLLAHTGKAASLIGKLIFLYCNSFQRYSVFCSQGGITIHGAFDFNFGHEITSSSDKKLAELRENLSELRLIIIDEMSLVSADMLYKTDAKLKEIFHLRKEIPFAGIGMMLVGDLLQIPPVKAGYIFGPPKNDKNKVAHDLVQHEGRFFKNKVIKDEH